MEPQRETMTDSLAAIIQIIHLGYQSGTLTVERGEGNMLQEGMIVFANGRVVEARAGQYSGLAAFNFLNTWQTCRFSFVSGTQTGPQALSPGRNEVSNSFRSASKPLEHNDQSSGYYNHVPALLPARLPAGEAALQRPETFHMPRTHRRLLLLVNGQRNISELTRILARPPEETQALLNDLERAGLIRQ
ncbi:MAG TPA: DUF4388 domain-containing protein [Ktedonobacteraceae bacterium]